MLQIVLGPDAALCRAVTRRLLTQLDPSGIDTVQLDGKDATTESLLAAVSPLSFFSARRVIVVRDLITSNASKRGEGSTKSESGRRRKAQSGIDFARLFEAAQGDNAVILQEPGLATLPASVKKILPDNAAVLSNECPRGHALIQWCVAYCENIGARIEKQSAQLLLTRLFPGQWESKASNAAFDRPPDIDRLSNELEKLATAAHPGAITPELVRDLAPVSTEDQIFGLLDAMTKGDLAASLTKLPDGSQLKEDAPRITAQAAQQAELSVAFHAASGHEPADIGRSLGISNPNRMYGVARALRGSAADPSRLLGAALEADRQFKAGFIRSPEDALYQIVMELASKPDEPQSPT